MGEALPVLSCSRLNRDGCGGTGSCPERPAARGRRWMLPGGCGGRSPSSACPAVPPRARLLPPSWGPVCGSCVRQRAQTHSRVPRGLIMLTNGPWPVLSRVTPMNKESLSRHPVVLAAVWLGQWVPAWELSPERLLQEAVLMIQQVMRLPRHARAGWEGDDAAGDALSQTRLKPDGLGH